MDLAFMDKYGMKKKLITPTQSHLEYYREHNIAPVRYDLSDLNAHFDRRKTLYNRLGLTKLCIEQSDILEVAAGTGHNSLYLATLNPKTLTLVEPNPAGIEHIKNTYQNYVDYCNIPILIEKKLEDFCPKNRFDIVVCENWLGNSPHELDLLRKLVNFIHHDGILVMTSVSPVGIIPNFIRRLFSVYAAPLSLSFEDRTKVLENCYTSHLNNLNGMNRNVTDWVQDNMINPAYYGVVLSIPKIIEIIGQNLEVIHSYPVFSEDWRWFKQLHGNNRNINEHFIENYWMKCHNFLDYAAKTYTRDTDKNIELEKLSKNIISEVQLVEENKGCNRSVDKGMVTISELLENFINNLDYDSFFAKTALSEALDLVKSPRDISVETLQKMEKFSKLFGRETIYISFQKVSS